VSSAYTLVRDPARVQFRYRDMLWEGSDLAALGVASFGHLSGLHYQNETQWDDYLRVVESGRLPIQRGLRPTHRELLIREMVLGLKRGRLDAGRLQRKFGVDPRSEWAGVWQELEAGGYLEPGRTDPALTRRGLLEVDRLLPSVFEAAAAAEKAVAGS
jgi:oxygen-independent coproporphyrinogen-3 oxidase